MAVTLNSLAKTFLPGPLYQQLAGSDIGKRVARGSFWSLFGSVTSRVLILAGMVLVARVLGQVPFGEFGLIQATLGVVGLMAGVGLGGTATRFVAQYAGTDPSRAGRVIALATSSSVVTIGLAAVALMLGSRLIAADILNAPHLQMALIWGALLMIATALRGIQFGVLAGLEKFDISAKLNILDGALSLVAMVLLARLMGVEGALLGLALSGGVVWQFGRVLLRNELRSRKITVEHAGCWGDWRILVNYSVPSFLANTVAVPVLWVAMVLVARSDGGFAELGLYNAAYQWHGPMLLIPMVLMSVSLPILVQEWEAGRTAQFRRVMLWICGVMLAITVMPVALLSFLSPWIMELYGPEFRQGWVILVLLLIAAPLHALAKISFAALLAMNRAWYVMVVNIIWGITLLTVTASLVEHAGAAGLAVAFVAAHAIVGIGSTILVIIGSRVSSSCSSRLTAKQDGAP